MTADLGLLEYAPCLLWLGLVALPVALVALLNLRRIGRNRW
jgi:hypothetical protein